MMPLEKGEQSGTEKDGTKSEKYCHYCYMNGEFADPVATMEKMKKISDDALKEKGWPKPLRWLSLSGFPRLERWRSRF